MLDVVIRGGRAVTPDGVGEWDVAIRGEQVVAIAAPGALTDDVGRVIDASDQLVIPGGVDPHVHTQMLIPGWQGEATYSGSPEQVSRAALYGGTTTLMDFATREEGESLAETIELRHKPWQQGYTDYSLHVLLQGAVPPEIVEQIPETMSGGYPTFKMYTTNVLPTRIGRMVPMGHLWAVMEQVARNDGMCAIHAEDHDLVMYMYDRLQREGRTGFENMPLAHTVMSEDLSFRRMIRLAQYVEGAALYFMHVGARTGVDAIAEARASGQPVYGETLHHYASFTAEAYLRPDGQIFHTYPSLKYEEDRQRLWSGLREGSLNTVATDEVCTPRAIKVRGKTIFDTTGGHVGVETRLPIVYTEGVVKRGLSLERFVELTSTNAARLMGMYPRKGAIASGSDADVVVFDPRIHRTLRAEELHGSDYSAWDGWEVDGWPSLVLLRGKVVVENGQLLGQAGQGRFIPRKLPRSVQDGPTVR